MKNLEKELTPEENEQLVKALSTKSLSTVFNFGYNLGWKKALEHVKEESEKFTKGFGYKENNL